MVYILAYLKAAENRPLAEYWKVPARTGVVRGREEPVIPALLYKTLRKGMINTNHIKIGDRTVNMTVNAATDAFFEKIFGYSSIILQTATELNSGQTVDLFYKLGFVMAMQAENNSRKMSQLDRNDYYKWLAEFDRGDYYGVIWKIRLTYEGWSDKAIDEYEKLNGDEINGG